MNYSNQALNNNNTPKGKFIVLEGLDRSGKSSTSKSVIKFIQEIHQNDEIYSTGFPNRTTKIGKMIDQFLRSKATEQLGQQAVHLLFSANRWECMPFIRQKLNQGIHVVCDRYWYSGVAYSSAKQNKNMNFEWCFNADKGLQKPDLIIYLRGDPQLLAKRQGYGGQRFEKIQFQKKVGFYFDKMLMSNKNSNNQSLQQNQKENKIDLKQKIKVINVQQKSKQEISLEVKNIINELFV